MPYFLGQTELSGTSKVLSYYGKGLDARTEPREQSSYFQREDYFADPERSRDPSLAEKLAPKYMRLSKQVTTLPDYILNGGDGYAHLPISDRVRRVIERFEPGRHYFSPIIVLKHDLSPWPEPYWLFRAAPSAVAQAMIVEQSPSLAWEPMKHPYLSYTKSMCRITPGGDLRPISQSSTDSAGGFVL